MLYLKLFILTMLFVGLCAADKPNKKKDWEEIVEEGYEEFGR